VVRAIVFSLKSMGVWPFVLLGFLHFWATFEPYFLGEFWKAFLAFFWPFKK